MRVTRTNIIMGIAILVAIILITILIISKEPYTKISDKEGMSFLKRIGISLEEAKELLPSVEKSTKMYDNSKFRKKSLVFNKGKKDEYIVPVLNSLSVRNPLLEKPPMKEFEPIPLSDISKLVKEKYFRFVPGLNNTRLGALRRQIQYIYEDNKRLSFGRLRTVNSSSRVLRDVLIDDLDWDWSDEVRGITFVDSNRLIIGNKVSLLQFRLGSSYNIRENDLNQDPIVQNRDPSTCEFTRLQGTIYKLRPDEGSNGAWRGRRQLYISLSACVSSGRRVLEFLDPSMISTYYSSFSLAPDLRPLWIARDPISDFIAIPKEKDISSISLYDFSRSYETSSIRLVREIPLTFNGGQSLTLDGVIAGTFTEGGLLHLLSNTLYGVYTFGLSADNNSFELRHVFGENSISDDTFRDSLVGLTSYHNELLILLKNDDTFDEDNLSIKRFAFRDLIPRNFSWNSQADVMNYYNRSLQIVPAGYQGSCGNCWSWTTTGILADRYAIINYQNVATELSVTYATSCDSENIDPCAGNMVYDAYDTLVSQGTVTNSCWDYNWLRTLPLGTTYPGAEFGIELESTQFITPCNSETRNSCVTCDNSTGTRICTELPLLYSQKFKAQPNTLRFLRGIDDIKLEILNGGPVSTSFEVYPDFMEFTRWSNTNGIYCHKSNMNLYNVNNWNVMDGAHAMVIVGWGEETIPNYRNAFGSNATVTIPYWICRNSWSNYFGNLGFVKIAMSNEELDINWNIGFDRPVEMGWWLFSWEWGGVNAFDAQP